MAWDQLHPQAPDPAVWATWPASPVRSAGATVQGQGGNGWWWTLAAVVVLLALILVGGMIAAIDGPSPGIRDSPVLHDNLGP